jgi:hypothetical protein
MKNHNVIPGLPIPNPVSLPQRIVSDVYSTLYFKGGINFSAGINQETLLESNLIESNLIIQHSCINSCGGSKFLKTVL